MHLRQLACLSKMSYQKQQSTCTLESAALHAYGGTFVVVAYLTYLQIVIGGANKA